MLPNEIRSNLSLRHKLHWAGIVLTQHALNRSSETDNVATLYRIRKLRLEKLLTSATIEANDDAPRSHSFRRRQPETLMCGKTKIESRLLKNSGHLVLPNTREWNELKIAQCITKFQDIDDLPHDSFVFSRCEADLSFLHRLIGKQFWIDGGMKAANFHLRKDIV